MLSRGAWIALAAALLATSCDDKPSSSSSSSGSSGGTTVTGKRLGWDQPAGESGDIAGYQYALYIDGARSVLTAVSCDNAAGPAGFACSVLLPTLPIGTHELEVSAFVVSDGTVLEGPRSSPSLRIVVSAAVTTPATALAVLRNGRITTADGAILKIDLVRADLAEPADLAFTPDRRLIVAESRGIIRIEPTASVPELTPNDVDGSLLAVALDPAFAATEQVFALSVASDGASANRTFTLARFREHEGRLIDRVVLLDGIPAASDPHGTIRFGPDGKLYVALDDGGSAASASDLSSENGKVLRLERDATTPADQDGLTPVFAHALHAPRALAFQPSTGELLVADQTPRGDELLLAIGRTRPRVRGVVRAAFRLPPPTTGAAALFYSSAAIPQFTGNLFVASDDGEHLLRLVFDPKNPSRIASTERLLRNTIGPLRAMAAAPDGSIYVATDVALWRLAAN